MNTSEILQLIGAFGLGALLTAVVSHFLAERRWERERRSGEIAKLRELADRYVDFHYRNAEATGLVAASEVPDDASAVVRQARKQLETLQTKLNEIDSLLGRAPEPLTTHLRLFMARTEAAFESRPPDMEAANHALVRFREAIDEYVRRGKTAAPRFRPDEPPLDDPY